MASTEMLQSAKDLRDAIMDSGYVMDPTGVHHEFVSGKHGQKLDFDKIPDDSELFDLWKVAVAERIQQLYVAESAGKIVLLSVANGTNRLVKPVADMLGDNYLPALTEKDTPRSVILTPGAKEIIVAENPDLVLAIEDVGTSGQTSHTAVLGAREAGATRVEALNSWQRRPELEKLVGIGATYHAVIKEELPAYEPEDCEAVGFCSWGWDFIPRGN